MDAGEARAFAERYTGAWCSGDPALVARRYAPDGSLTINEGTPSIGSEEITAAAKAFMDAFPDLTVVFDGLRDGPNGWAYRWTLDGTHAETGNHVRVSGHKLWQLGYGVIQSSRGQYDQAEYDRQVSAAGSDARYARRARNCAA